MSFEYIRPIPSTKDIFDEIPMSEDSRQVKVQRDAELKAVFEGRDPRFVLIIGPCSADNEDSVCEYVRRLSALQAKVKDRIWVAKKHMEYEDTQEVLPNLIPIYASLNDLVDVMPVEAATTYLDEAKEHHKWGDKEKAREALEATDAALQYAEVDLPPSTTRLSRPSAKGRAR